MLFSRVADIRNCWAKRTGSILAAADLDEALDVGDFAGHVGGICLNGSVGIILKALV